MQTDLKYELHNVLSGKSKVRYGATIQAIASYLSSGEKSSQIIENEKLFRKQETERLINYTTKHDLPVEPIFIIIGIDELMDMARTSVNVIGNCLATAVIARSEGELVEN